MHCHNLQDQGKFINSFVPKAQKSKRLLTELIRPTDMFLCKMDMHLKSMINVEDTDRLRVQSGYYGMCMLKVWEVVLGMIMPKRHPDEFAQRYVKVLYCFKFRRDKFLVYQLTVPTMGAYDYNSSILEG